MSPFLTQEEVLFCVSFYQGVQVASGHSLSERRLESIMSKISADAGRCSKINYTHGEQMQKSMYSTELATRSAAKDKVERQAVVYEKGAFTSCPSLWFCFHSASLEVLTALQPFR